ncbi:MULTISPECIES: hypothetical protein [Serratia]|uniref:Uncharacterized protein n=1 Tax=Serratia bockelmannii TaxID=2703793 RepID=A0ABT8LLP1_9GAMM|nr:MULTISPECIES: hypothetical protein [Serratia]EMB2734019.1 hypothetical protein [Serratia marcescens]MBH2623787.1 hypothetical protein [Serratia marcescens]MBH3232277.1 hypothetical protein [Serratia marcescens]MDN6877123.1 hypothetical protein [Serratia bockelmannii]
MAVSVVRALCVTIVYRLDGDIKTFRHRIDASSLMDRFFRLEAGDTNGLFIPVGKGQQVSSGNVEWFEIIRVMDGCDCPDQYKDYLS